MSSTGASKLCQRAACPRRGRLGLAVAATFALVAACASQPPANHRTLGLRHAAAAEHAYKLGRYGAAAHNFNQALRHLRAADDTVAVARLLHNHAVVLIAWKDCAAASGYLHEAAALNERQTQPQQRALNLLALAGCQRKGGDQAAAGKSLTLAADLATKAGNKATAARAHAGLGAMKSGAGDLAGAAVAYAEAERLATSAAEPGALALVRNNQGRLLARRGSHGAAEKRFAQAADGYRRAGESDGMAQALANRATSLQALGDKRGVEAAILFQRAGHAAVTVARYASAASWFASAAALFAANGQVELAEQCRSHGRKVLDASAR